MLGQKDSSFNDLSNRQVRTTPKLSQHVIVRLAPSRHTNENGTRAAWAGHRPRATPTAPATCRG